MIQLYINGKLCDIDDDFKIRLEKDFDNKTEHVIEQAEYSFEIDLPITDRNRECFGYTDVFDVGAKFNQNYDAILNVDETNILKGKFVMDSISNDEFSGNLYVPAMKSLKNVLGDKKMKDIKAHNVTIATWKQISEHQWKIFNGDADADNHVIMPYILYSLPYNNSESQYDNFTQDMSASGSTFSPDNVFPCYNVLSVLKDVFEGEGYNIQGNIFKMKKFEDLYQTFSYDPKKYNEEKEVPYFLRFQFDYAMRTSGNTSETALDATLFNDPEMKWGTDAILLSENTKLQEIDDEYNMLVKSKKSNARTLVVPQSGWYQIDCSGMMELPVQNGSWSQDGRITITGRYNDNDRVDLSQNMMEFQIKKTDAPLSNSKIYSYNMGIPMSPNDVIKSNCHVYDFVATVELAEDEKSNMFAKNGGTALAYDYSGEQDFSDLIAAARFGCQYSSHAYDDDRFEDRLSEEMFYTCLPNPQKATMIRVPVGGEDYDGNREKPLMLLYNILGLHRSDDNYRYDYGSQTAQVIVRNDSYSNFEGYNKFNMNKEGSGGTWDTTSNFKRRVYAGQGWSGAQVRRLASGNEPVGGGFMISTCAWLEKGENISLEFMTPYNDYADECGWLEFCSFKHWYKGGPVNTHINANFSMYIVSTDKKYIPTNEKPIPPSPYDLPSASRAQVNINKFLGDTKVNDWIENLLKTFNLKLTKIGDKTYSIDTMLGEAETYGNIIDIDEWANVNDASFKRIDAKNTTLEWTISSDEEGYQKGNNTKVNKTKRDESGYTGSVTFTVPSSNAEEKIKSNYSYTWMKDIKFVNTDAAFSGEVKTVPVIADEERWENNYLTVEGQDPQSDKTARLVYLKRDPNTNLIDYVNVQGYKDDTDIPEIKAPLFFVDNQLTYKSSLGTYKTFHLDYSDTEFGKDDESITDVFFAIKRGTQYEVDVPVTLPNDIYSRIKANTLVKFNDCLFRVLGIEGHNVNMTDTATLKLITLK